MDRRPSVERRNRLVNRVSAMGQLSALVAMASTGITAGALAHAAQVKDARAAAARPTPSAAPAPIALVPKPIRTVLVRVPVPAAKRRTSSTVGRTVAVRSAPRTVVRAAPVRVPAPVRVAQPAPRPVAKPAAQPATTSTGS